MADHFWQTRVELRFQIFVGVDVEQTRDEPLTGNVMHGARRFWRQVHALGRDSPVAQGNIDRLAGTARPIENLRASEDHIPLHVRAPVHHQRASMRSLHGRHKPQQTRITAFAAPRELPERR